MPCALITGITGQDGAYLAHFLLNKGYAVSGITRPSTASPATAETAPANLEALGIGGQVHLLAAALNDADALRRAIEIAEPDEIYHLAAQSSPGESWQIPVETGDYTALALPRLLEAVRAAAPGARFFQASSADMYGEATESPQTERTVFRPQSPYGIAKLYAHWMTVAYRKAYGCHASCGILFNHESPLRSARFVTRKVTQAAARIKCGMQDVLTLGNLEVRRDWGFAGDFVEAMWTIVQQEQADDYVMATGHSHSLREFVDLAFQCVGLNYQDYVRSDPAFYRPVDPAVMVGDASRLRERTGWTPRVSFEEMVRLMVEADLNHVQCGSRGITYWPA